MTLTAPAPAPAIDGPSLIGPIARWRPPSWAVFVALFLLAMALAQLLAFFAERTGNGSSEAITAESLEKLPARPEDIEAHGEKAKSVLAPDDARARNAAVAFTADSVVSASSFAFRGSEEDRARATACLATAVLYEAGDDTIGQAAVAQVILNRVRHPVFPGTVCGVVYQGSERRTGCQFTFTCDGSLRRVMPDAAWTRARQVARNAIGGFVDKTVGLATHYHTNWVYPYWSPSLNKLAQVGTHLFFGWPGGWGGPRAFSRVYRGNEAAPGARQAMVPQSLDATGELAVAMPESPKILGLPMPKAELPEGMGNVPLYGNKVKLVGGDGRSFGLLAPGGQSAAKLVNAATSLCAKPGPCQVGAWVNEDDVPGEFPVPAGARSTMVFEYVRAGGSGGGSLRFDCTLFPNKDPSRCLDAPKPDLEGVLPGVRFKSP